MNKISIFDLHQDFVMTCYEKGHEYQTVGQTDLEQLKKTGVKLIFSGFSYDDEFKDTEKQLSIIKSLVKLDSKFKLIENRRDLISQFSKPKMLIHLEGARVIKNVSTLNEYFRQGIRSIGLTHNHGNQLAFGCNDDPTSHLTNLGKAVVKRANKLGMIIDASHINHAGFFDLLETSDSPVIISHGNTQKFCNKPRNFSDDQIRSLAQQGGVIGVFFSAAYVNPVKELASIDDVVNHALHIIEIGGIDCLSIGSDFGGITTGLPAGLENTTKLSDLLHKLSNMGLSPSDIEKVAYKNILRVLNKVLK